MGADRWSRFGWVIAGGVIASLARVIYDAVGDGIGVNTLIAVVVIAAVATAVAVAVQFTASRRGKS